MPSLLLGVGGRAPYNLAWVEGQAGHSALVGVTVGWTIGFLWYLAG